ncbi:MAG TPA: hypothetical protein VFO74_11355, partial [Pseudolabrys sp.]|nr:hypothetical protein [Pseudolabrys sp.]
MHIAEVSYEETGVFDVDHERLKNKTDTFLNNVHTLRDTFGADVVVMITEKYDWCGMASQMG